MSNYWIKRAQAAEEIAQRAAATYIKSQKQIYLEAYERINNELLALSTQTELTRSQLYNSVRYKKIKETIEKEFNVISSHQVKEAEELLNKVFKETISTSLTDLGINANVSLGFTPFQVIGIINENWVGSNYSQRIWENNTALAERIKQDMERLITQGTSPQTLTKQLMKDFDMGYTNTSRLIRTETSHVYNRAREESYKQAGIKQVEYVAELDSRVCPICQPDDGRIFTLENKPFIPRHPNCRCCYAPVVEI